MYIFKYECKIQGIKDNSRSIKWETGHAGLAGVGGRVKQTDRMLMLHQKIKVNIDIVTLVSHLSLSSYLQWPSD